MLQSPCLVYTFSNVSSENRVISSQTLVAEAPVGKEEEMIRTRR